jgi:hypothetical protein
VEGGTKKREDHVTKNLIVGLATIGLTVAASAQNIIGVSGDKLLGTTRGGLDIVSDVGGDLLGKVKQTYQFSIKPTVAKIGETAVETYQVTLKPAGVYTGNQASKTGNYVQVVFLDRTVQTAKDGIELSVQSGAFTKDQILLPVGGWMTDESGDASEFTQGVVVDAREVMSEIGQWTKREVLVPVTGATGDGIDFVAMTGKQAAQFMSERSESVIDGSSGLTTGMSNVTENSATDSAGVTRQNVSEESRAKRAERKRQKQKALKGN